MANRQSPASPQNKRREMPAPPPPSPPDDPSSRASAQAEEHELERAKSEHARDELSRKLIGYGIATLIVTVFIVIIGSVVTLGVHHLLPEDTHWLGSDRLQDVKNFVLSGAVVGLGVNYARRYFDGPNRSSPRD